MGDPKLKKKLVQSRTNTISLCPQLLFGKIPNSTYQVNAVQSYSIILLIWQTFPQRVCAAHVVGVLILKSQLLEQYYTQSNNVCNVAHVKVYAV